MVLQPQNRAQTQPSFFKAGAAFLVFIITFLSFVPGGSISLKVSTISHSSIPSTGHWRASRRIYPNQQASSKSAVEVPFNFYPPQTSPERIFRVAQDRNAAVPPLNRRSPAVLFSVLRI